MIVVDTNIIAYLFLVGEKTPLAQAARRQDPEWIVPSLWKHEFLNVLATYIRRKGITEKVAEAVRQRAVQLLAPAEREVDMRLALELAARHRVSAYDAQYIALAQKLKVLCVTEDARLLKTFPTATRSLAEFCHQAGS